MSGLIGKKIGMTSLFDEIGKNIPCTILELGPCIVTQIKTKEKDGYKSFQLSYDDKSEKQIVKSEKGHFKKANTLTKKKLIEFKGFEEDLKLGDSLTVNHFVEGEYFIQYPLTSSSENTC